MDKESNDLESQEFKKELENFFKKLVSDLQTLVEEFTPSYKLGPDYKAPVIDIFTKKRID